MYGKSGHLSIFYFLKHLTRSIQDSETSIGFVQGPPGSRRERVNDAFEVQFFSRLQFYTLTKDTHSM